MMSQRATSLALLHRAVTHTALPAANATFRSPNATPPPAVSEAGCQPRIFAPLMNTPKSGMGVRGMSILASGGCGLMQIPRTMQRKEQRGMAKKKGKKGGKGGDADENDDSGDKKKKGGKKGKGKEEEDDIEIDVEEEISNIMTELDTGMKDVLSHLDEEFFKFRTGRADPRMLERVRVKQHAVEVSLNHVAQVTAPDPKTLSVQVFDPDLVVSVEKALRTSGLDVNPVVAGQTIRIPIPKMTQETRTKLAKQAAQLGETAKVRARRVRHSALEKGNKLKLSKDDQKRFDKDVQVDTDAAVKEIDERVKAKQGQLKND